MQHRPFAGFDALVKIAEDVWWQLGEADWKEAFSHHPKIGDVSNLRARFASSAAWSEGEQAGVNAAAEQTLQALADLNCEYENKFGYIFIVCASGKTAEQMLALLRERLANSAEKEIRIAAAEQSKITALRLEKLCTEVQSQPTC